MRDKLKDLLWFYPNNIVLSTQTLYESIFALMTVYKITDKIAYLNEALLLAQKLAKLQNKNGGFDIGFNFLFGKGKMKPKNNSPTSPETLSIYALHLVQSEFKKNYFDNNIKKCAAWIQDNWVGENEKSISYCPDLFKENHICNANSFSSLAMASYDFLNKSSLSEKLSMTCYKSMSNCEKSNSKFFYYFNTSSHLNNDERQLDKIDYSHLAQQGWCHMRIYLLNKNKIDLVIAQHIFDYLIFQLETKGVLNYCADTTHSPRHLPLWGCFSIIIFLVEWYMYTNDDRCFKYIGKYASFILDYGMSENHDLFACIDKTGIAIDKSRFIRSESWGCHAFAKLYQATRDEIYLSLFEETYSRLKNDNFSGREPNRWNLRKYYSIKFRDFIFMKKSNI